MVPGGIVLRGFRSAVGRVTTALWWLRASGDLSPGYQACFKASAHPFPLSRWTSTVRIEFRPKIAS